ncbi:hypothetical protein A2V56_02085 [Candidatus Woesebacteria bacterium RBG_19FT_COMBO_42_9]|uniref:Uncharacterized protein n=1 Tax=Candidatus Woesebacteria bacterium RBG_16_42_24 TaxID=1802485 RepID=A0A1F7XKY5_9BACT|nr:MAG: hypothetical protein A2V97_02795 [Candidatus Woesebacteria bacterium RBG_16_42_24]OGM16468.1 MAG: hypothetical protein A2V56_02085 [Candidatus Woesebacteria bacterium RBG_19FT_COMBO_42_9]OGM66224.1 MAG: hypothetical protein A2985_00090 [Candidatus Woesebacteria bacterium RIFCSPLOWO2_01_FULL_43_11]
MGDNSKIEWQVSEDAGPASWKESFAKSFEGLETEPFSKRLQAISETLSPQDLGKLPDWSPNLTKGIASYLAQNAPFI